MLTGEVDLFTELGALCREAAFELLGELFTLAGETLVEFFAQEHIEADSGVGGFLGGLEHRGHRGTFLGDLAGSSSGGGELGSGPTSGMKITIEGLQTISSVC